MKWVMLEKRLKTRMLIQRIVMITLIIGLTACAIVGNILFTNSKEVVVHGVPDTPFTWEEVKYNYDYLNPFIFGAFGAVLATLFFIFHLIYCKYRIVELGRDVIIVYRGLIIDRLYVNGEKAGTKSGFSLNPVITAELSDGIVIYVSFVQKINSIAYVSFSTNTSAIYI